MLSVMRDPNADVERRDRMAIEAAKYLHSRPSIGMKAAAHEAAERAARYAGLMQRPPKLVVFTGKPH